MTGFGAFADGGLAWTEAGEVVDLRSLGDVFAQPTLNALMAAGPAAWREAIAAARAHDGPRIADPQMRLPFDVADYVDFYASLEHASNLGRMFRPDQEPLLPNWRWLPVGYHGRAGTVVVSGTDVVRPRGQLRAGEFGPSQRLDVELELGFVVGVPSARPLSHGRRSPTTSSASCSSTTGAPATFRRSSTCRSGRSSASRSRPPSRPG